MRPLRTIINYQKSNEILILSKYENTPYNLYWVYDLNNINDQEDVVSVNSWKYTNGNNNETDIVLVHSWKYIDNLKSETVHISELLNEVIEDYIEDNDGYSFCWCFW